jgi:hypothetical protein
MVHAIEALYCLHVARHVPFNLELANAVHY